MYYLIVSVGVALLMYWILQSKEDARNASDGRPPTPTPKRIMLLFLLIIVATCICFLINSSLKTEWNSEGGRDDDAFNVQLQPNYKINMIKNINEDVLTGIPPFSTVN